MERQRATRWVSKQWKTRGVYSVEGIIEKNGNFNPLAPHGCAFPIQPDQHHATEAEAICHAIDLAKQQLILLEQQRRKTRRTLDELRARYDELVPHD